MYRLFVGLYGILGGGGGCKIEGSGRVKAEKRLSGSSAGSRLRALGSLNPKLSSFVVQV